MASKARAVWWLGLLGLVTGPVLGGVVPATVALVLGAEFRRQAVDASGWLPGTATARRGETMARAGLVLALVALVMALVVGAYLIASAPRGPAFPPSVD